MRRLFLYISCICLALLSYLQVRAERIDTLLHFNLADLQIDTVTAPDGQSYTKLFYPGCENDDQLGAPSLPTKYIRITLPYNASGVSVDYTTENITSISLDDPIFPAQRAKTGNWTDKELTFALCDNNIYASKSMYPSRCCMLTENSSLGKNERQAVISVRPITYKPSESTMFFQGLIKLSLTYHSTMARTSASNSSTDIGIPFYEYTVITSRELKDSFQRLIAWKRQKGINAGVVCVEDIIENDEIDGDTYSHRDGYSHVYLTDDAAKIREYLRFSYEAGVAKYVLMGGCPDIVPIRFGTGENNTWEDEEYEDMKIPTDHYFAELYSNWNRDNDIYLGEPSDNLDYGCQLSVGRILCSTTQDVDNYTNKLLLYEMNPGKGNSSYLRSAFYQASDNWMHNPTSPSLLFNRGEYVAQRAINSFPDTTIISEYNVFLQPTIYPTGNEVMSAMRQKNYGYVTLMGHGSPYRVIVRSINTTSSSDWKHWVISSKQHISHPDETYSDSFAIENANGLDKLTNKNFPMIAFSHGCMNAPFDEYSNFNSYPTMAQSFTMGKDYGGPAFIGHTRFSYINASYLVQEIFNNKLRRKDIGTSLHRGKYEYVGIKKHYTVLSTNLIGCPEFNVWTDTLQSLNASIEYDTDEGYITLDELTNDTVIIGQRYITDNETENDSTSFRIIPYHDNEQVFYPPWNCLITLTGRNYRPKIMPLYLQNAVLRGKRYIYAKDVTCTSEVLENTIADEGGVSFEAGSDYTFETCGTFRMEKGVTVKLGAKLCIKSSTLDY